MLTEDEMNRHDPSMLRNWAPPVWLEKKLPGLLFGWFGCSEVMRT